MQKMLEKDPLKRQNCIQLLNHTWFQRMKPDRTAKYFGFPTLSTIKEGTEKQDISSRYSISREKLSIELPG
jgi:hypothetical protein